MSPWAVVAVKEIRDHARDGRSVSSALLYALMGPLVLLVLSFSATAGLAGRPTALHGMMAVFLLVSAFVGGINVAMDAIAGERERRSLVPLLATAVSRDEIVIGKWLAIGAFNLAGLLLNLVAFALVPSMSAVVPRLWTLAVGLAPLAILAAAVELAISTVCRNTKEAHTYLSILVFAPMMAGLLLVFFPSWQSGWLDVMPVVGHYGLVEETLAGGTGLTAGAAALGAITLAATAPTLTVAARLLGRDDVVLGRQ